MLSRRNIRIKIMQLLYSDSVNEQKSGNEELQKEFGKWLNASQCLFYYNIWFLKDITRFAIKDGELRKAKHRPTEIDKVYSPKLFDNPCIKGILNNELLVKRVKENGIDTMIDQSVVKKCYFDFSKTAEYREFLQQSESTTADYIDILLQLFKFNSKNESFQETLDDHFYFWKTDKSLIVGVMKKFLKSLPDNKEKLMEFLPGKDILDDFAFLLLESTIINSEENRKNIKEALQNWEMDRVAKLDLILLEMAISELLTFPSIPGKVSINEYVEISKSFSTDKSREFINGILDRQMKAMEESGRIQKSS